MENKNNKAQKKAVVQPTKEKVERDKRLEELNQLRISTMTVLPPEKSIINVEGVPIFEQRDIGALKGKQKCGKTSVLKVLVSTWIKGDLFGLESELKNAKILWIDSEQKPHDVKQILDDIMQMTCLDAKYIDSHLRLYTVRTLSCKTLINDIELLINDLHPNVIIIDGLVDLVESFNDEAQSHLVINRLIQMCDVYKCSIIGVLHENKSNDDRNMRGHLGTMLAQKAGTVLECKKDSNNVITVSCSDSRHRAMPDWRIKYDEFGHIVSADGNQITPAEQEMMRRIEIIRNFVQEKGGEISRKELTDKLIKELGRDRSTVSNIISKLVKNSTLYEMKGKDKDMIGIQPLLDLTN